MNRSINTTLTPILVQVADMYYSRRLSQQQIAESLGVSRSLVALYLQKAREQGIVRIEVVNPQSVNTDLNQRLKAFGRLRRLEIVPVNPLSASITCQSSAAALAFHLDAVINNGDCLGVGFGEMTAEVAGQFPRTRDRKVDVVAITGEPSFIPAGMVSPVHRQVERIAAAFNGQPYYLPAPLVLETEQTCQLLSNDASIRPVTNRWDRLTHIICDISPISTSGFFDDIPGSETLSELCGMDCVGEICMRFFDREARFLYHPMNKRVMSISAKQISRVENVLVAASGVESSVAVACLVKCGLVTDLFLDEDLARAVLSVLEK